MLTDAPVDVETRHRCSASIWRHRFVCRVIERNPASEAANEVSVLLVEALVRSVPGLRIAHKSTGAQGVERAGRLQPDLILVDQQLPEFDDFDHYETKPIRFKPFLEALERRFPARAA